MLKLRPRRPIGMLHGVWCVKKRRKLVDAAAFFGLTVGGMHRVINGVPNIIQAKKLAEFLEVDFNELFEFDDTKNKFI